MLKNYTHIKEEADKGNIWALQLLEDIRKELLFSDFLSIKEKLVVKHFLILDKSREEVAIICEVGSVQISRICAKAVDKLFVLWSNNE